MKKLFPIVLFILGLSFFNTTHAQTSSGIGTIAPDFSQNTPEGKALALNSLRGKYVLVDFWAEWCGPCKMIAPVLDEIAVEYEGKLKIAKVDVDANPEIAPKFGIRGIPTLIVFKGGNAEATKVGALSKTQLTEFIQEVV